MSVCVMHFNMDRLRALTRGQSGSHSQLSQFHLCPLAATFTEGAEQVLGYQFLNLYRFKFVFTIGFLNMLCY